jgi:hypothetical protein
MTQPMSMDGELLAAVRGQTQRAAGEADQEVGNPPRRAQRRCAIKNELISATILIFRNLARLC